MSQNEERARAIRQARKLMEMTTAAGASENEAQIAMERLSKIRQTFNLTLDEIVVSNMEYVTAEVEQTAKRGCVLGSVVVGIGRFTDTKIWQERPNVKYSVYVDKYGRSKYRRTVDRVGTYKFFGIDSDVEMAKFLYEIIVREMIEGERKYTQSAEYRRITDRGGKRRARISFRKGFATRIYRRLADLAERNRAESQSVAMTGKDIVVVKEKIREDKFKQSVGIKLVSRRRYARGITNGSAGIAGANTANNVNFNRPINSGGGSTIKLLTS